MNTCPHCNKQLVALEVQNPAPDFKGPLLVCPDVWQTFQAQSCSPGRTVLGIRAGHRKDASFTAAELMPEVTQQVA